MSHANNNIIILIHGLMRTSKCMQGLASYLNREGYEIFLYEYASTEYTIKEHGSHLKKFIETIITSHPHKKLHFIGHSLGGIIAREALAQLTQEQLNVCVNLIMLAPPNRGSRLARFFVRTFPFTAKFVRPLTELSSDEEAYIHQVAIPEKINIGVIAGRFDAKAPPAFTHLKGQKDFLVVNAVHTFIMNHPKCRKAILHFLRVGVFQ